jgi:hypothetical protein
MDLRQERVSIETDRYHIEGALTPPSEGPVCIITVSAEGVGEQHRIVGAALVVGVAHRRSDVGAAHPRLDRTGGHPARPGSP